MSDAEEAYESAKESAKDEKAEVDSPEISEDEKDASDYEPLVKKKKAGRPPNSSKKTSPAKSKSPAKKKAGRPAKAIKKVPVKEASSDDEVDYEVEEIVGHTDRNGKLRYKIRWLGYDSKQDTWEDFRDLSCPDLLERYNLKHNIVIRKSHSAAPKKGKVGRKKKTAAKKSPAKKRRVSESDESSHSESFEPEDNSVELNDDDNDPLETEFEVSKIRDMRKKNGKREFLVHWFKWGPEHDTWEPEEHLNCQDLIDKFLEKLEEAKKTEAKELRFNRKKTDRFTLNTKEVGRRLSRRNDQTQRVKYHDEDLSDE